MIRRVGTFIVGQIRTLAAGIAAAAVLAGATTRAAQPSSATGPSTSATTPAKATDAPAALGAAAPELADVEGRLRFQVAQLAGVVSVGAADADPDSDEGWKPARIGELLGAGVQVRIDFRSAVKLIAVIPERRENRLVAVPADPATVVMIEHASLLFISEALFKEGVARSRWKLAYGAIRAGVAEGVSRSDMEIECPKAVLSKKGTDIFRFEYRDNRWSMSLSERGRGLIQAMQLKYDALAADRRPDEGRLRTRFVSPGQMVTHEMLRTIETTVFNRTINPVDTFGLSGDDLKFTLLNNHGFAILLPGGNPIDIWGRTGRRNPDEAGPGPGGNLMMTGVTPAQTGNLPLQQFINELGRRQPRAISDGDFGIGSGTVPALGGFSQRLRLGDARRAISSRLIPRSGPACRP